MSFITDIRFAFRSLARVKGLAVTVVVTLALASAPMPPSSASSAGFSCGRWSIAMRLVHLYVRARPAGGSRRGLLVPEIQDLRARIRTLNAFGELFHDSVHDDWPRRAARGACGRRRGLYFEVMAAARARPPAGAVRRRPGGGRGGGAHVPLGARRSRATARSRQDGTARRPHGHHRGRSRTFGAVPVGDRDYRQRRHEPAPSFGDDAGWGVYWMTQSSAPGAGRRARGGARAAGRPRRDR